jgi:hypothetical protein
MVESRLQLTLVPCNFINSDSTFQLKLPVIFVAAQHHTVLAHDDCSAACSIINKCPLCRHACFGGGPWSAHQKL